jgi:O-methyltransferase
VITIEALRDRYIDLLIRAVANTIYEDPPHPEFVNLPGSPPLDERAPELRLHGEDWPSQAHSMMGVARLKNLAELTRRAIEDGTPGDFIETGVWRGGGCILMRGVIAAYGAESRRVFVADSFEGLPLPSPELYPADRGDTLHQHQVLAVPEAEVRRNFERYGLLDERVRFVKGFFSDTLPTLDVEPLALLRLDGDMYESTIVALDALYPKLSSGGFVIVDDFGAAPACRRAVEDYRLRNHIIRPMQNIDWTGVWWQKP